MTNTVQRILTSAMVTTALIIGTFTARPSAADREHQQMMADLRMLQEQTQQLQSLLNGLGEALKAVNTRLDDQTALERKAFADGKVQMDGVSNDIRIVREKVDETNVRLGSLSQELEALRDSLPPPGTVAVPVPTTSDAAPLPDGTPAPPAPTTAASPTLAGASPERLWGSSFSDYGSGNYSFAISGFETYLKSYPKGARAPEAQLYIGQSYEADKKLTEALAAYDRVIANYPTATDQVATAYYKRGGIFEQQGQADRARESYETIMKQYPTTPTASLAKQRLEALTPPAKPR
jgi:tol-pal system protein YbgF